MPYKDKKKQAAYQNEWMKAQRKEWIAQKGGKCRYCGDTKDLQLHRRVYGSDETHRVWSLKKETREKYLRQVNILCRQCVTLTQRVRRHTLAQKDDLCLCETCGNWRRALARRRQEEPRGLST